MGIIEGHSAISVDGACVEIFVRISVEGVGDTETPVWYCSEFSVSGAEAFDPFVISCELSLLESWDETGIVGLAEIPGVGKLPVPLVDFLLLLVAVSGEVAGARVLPTSIFIGRAVDATRSRPAGALVGAVENGATVSC